MRSKTPLALMEQLVMILVFALAAAMCVRMFTLSDRLSRKNEAVSQAALVTQNLAEEIKGSQGELSDILSKAGLEPDGELWICAYDRDWNQIEPGDQEEIRYRLEVQEEETGITGLRRARIAVMEEEMLFEIPVAWQEVSGHE